MLIEDVGAPGATCHERRRARLNGVGGRMNGSVRYFLPESITLSIRR